MKRLLVILAMLAATEAGAFSYATGACTDGCASGEKWLHTNANEVDTALDNLEAGTSIASAITRDVEWDTAAEINSATTDDDFVMVNGTHDLDITGSASFSGSIQGLVSTVVVSASTNSPDASGMRGGLYQCTNASGCDITLPTAVGGYNACWYDNNGGGVITLDAASGDLIILDGVPQPTAEAIDSAGARGDFICILALDATNWVTLGRSGTFIAGGAD